MVHSIEFTKIWTNIYSQTHPQQKHFSSKQVPYGWQSLYAQTSLKRTGSLLCGRREARREGQGRKKKRVETPNSSKAKFCSMKMKALKEKWANTFLDMANHFRGRQGFLGTRACSPLAGQGEGWGRTGPWCPHFHLFCRGVGTEQRQPLGDCTGNLNQPPLQTTQVFMWKINYFLSCTIKQKTANGREGCCYA